MPSKFGNGRSSELTHLPAHANPDPNKYNTMNYTSGMDANHTHKTTPQKKKAAHAREVERQTEQQKKDPTLPAQMHFNKPGTGPRIDKELMEDDAKMLDKKDKQRERKAKGKQADIEREIEREARSVSVEA